MIETDQLRRTFAEKVALERLTLTVKPGEILGFLGPNGAGKSTTVKILAGMLKPTSGRATVAGFDVSTHPLEVKRRIGYVPEAAALYESLARVNTCSLSPLSTISPSMTRSGASAICSSSSICRRRWTRDSANSQKE